MRRVLLIVFALCSSACGLRAREDGGMTDGGAPPPFDSGSPGPDSGSPSPDSGTPAFAWGKMSPPQATIYTSIWGRGSGPSVVLYAARNPHHIDRFEDGGWTSPYLDSANIDYLSIWVSPNEEVFAVGSSYALACVSDCSAQASWTRRTVASVGFTGVCGRDIDHVYAVGNLVTHVGVLLRYNPSTTLWDFVSMDTGSVWNMGCWVAPDDGVYLAAQSKILHYDGNAFTAETIAFPAAWTMFDIASMYFNAVGGFGSDVYAGGTLQRVVWRDAAGQWRFVFDPPPVGGDVHAIAAEANAVFAGGSGNGTNNVAAGLRQTWAFDPRAPKISVYGAWAAGPNEYYLAGADGTAGAIYKVTR